MYKIVFISYYHNVSPLYVFVVHDMCTRFVLYMYSITFMDISFLIYAICVYCCPTHIVLVL